MKKVSSRQLLTQQTNRQTDGQIFAIIELLSELKIINRNFVYLTTQSRKAWGYSGWSMASLVFCHSSLNS